MKLSRKLRSWACANIILAYGLFDEFKIYSYHHPKIKSRYRLANLFLLNKGLLYSVPDNWSYIPHLNMDNLESYYYE